MGLVPVAAILLCIGSAKYGIQVKESGVRKRLLGKRLEENAGNVIGNG